jgi:SAM-dependent methyltransferase
VSALDVTEAHGLGTPAPELACPSCGGQGLHLFHEQLDIPVHSVRLVQSREEALRFPRGTLRLGFCGGCGFITNTAYEPALQDYAVAYEETQGYSPKFRAFSQDLAARWIARYGLRGRTVLEIGHGKGEFLADMIEAGAGHGIGIDPSYDGRLTGPAAERITFIDDYYSEAYADLVADAVICRHTLEHIGPVGELLATVRRSLAERPGTPVLFELPDVLRVLDEIAFWDIYYEHCSYFTPGSLARAYRHAGLEVLDVALDYDDQYILIEGRPSRGTALPEHRLEEPVDAVADAVRAFRGRFARIRDGWIGRLAAARAEERRVVIWGAGSKGVSFLTTLGVEREISYAVDINPHKHDKFMAATGQQVVAPEFLREYRPDLVIVMNPIYLDEIGAQLAAMDLHPELVSA